MPLRRQDGGRQMIRVWTAETRRIVRESWGVDEPREIASRINECLAKLARQPGAGRYGLTGRKGVGVIFEAHRQGLIELGERDRLVAQARRQGRDIRASVRAELFAAQPVCQHCGARQNLQVDHIVPVVHGGDSSRENLQVLCAKCNFRKGTHSDEFIRAQLAERIRQLDKIKLAAATSARVRKEKKKRRKAQKRARRATRA